MSDSVIKGGKAQYSKKNDENAERKTENTSLPSFTNMKVIPPLTIVLIGDPSSIEIGSKNILIDHDKQTNVKQFSSNLYNLCGRHICVISMLGLQNIVEICTNQGIHAFLLLLANGQHSSQYSSGVQWLENVLGRRALSYLITVVTHESDEKCESALKELKDTVDLVEKRYHTCKRNMKDEKEIIGLLEKIDVMVSENDPESYSLPMCAENKEQKGLLKDKSPEEKKKDSEDQIYQKRDDLETSTVKTQPKCDQVNEDSPTTGAAKVKSLGLSAVNKQGTSVSGNKEVSEEKRRNELYQTLLGRLHLQDKLQGKFSPADFLQISPPLKNVNKISEKDLSFTFITRLMMLDYRARYIPVGLDSSNVTNQTTVQEIDITENDFSSLGALLSATVDTNQKGQTNVHPLDVQMAIFHCSNRFLKQIMITKLSHCQYALPLLVPDPVTKDIECPLWTFRQITKTWKVTQTKEGKQIVTTKSIPIYKAETPLVSFFRLGSLSVSKSQLMNTLINDRHNTFFHRNCPGSTRSHYLIDGLAEIAWYCPSGKPNDAFSDCIAFCNLHGDVLSAKEQFDILTKKSSVNIFLVPSLQKNDNNWLFISNLLTSQMAFIFLSVNDSCDVVKTKNGKYIIGLKDKSQAEVSEKVKQVIREVLSPPRDSILKPSFQLETMTKLPRIRVDESDPACQNGKCAAMKIVTLLTKDTMDVSKIKDKFLLCQGDLWHRWSRKHKELYHLRGDIEKEKIKKKQELMEIRKKQFANSHSKLMELFIRSISMSSTEKEYFLKWTQILIDALSRDDLSVIRKSYGETWSEVLALKNNHDNSEQLLSKQKELEDIAKKLQSATFGLEHMFREMGQIYEACRTLRGQSRLINKYPELAAQLMMSGHQVELMDGDAGHVPLMWISSLLEEVSKKLGDKTVFVLSVLGLQSSGKSTMLNTMFGLQFAVSAGRCTKGAFMQLLKVSEEMKKDFKFDYILVVDTEGLRALELKGNTIRHHDNELATFVIGLGNLTLINIFGENPSDMQDILQIVVQAFMRMKRVQLSPSCVFVHQNVTDVAAADQMMDGKRRLQERLDQMAKLAAEEEVCSAECFSDIIEFDVRKDVKYCAQLWEGSPPMAPPNPGYSESIQELKDTILSKASKSAGITFSKFKTKIQDLWTALLNENFVFSFKNALEIAAYRKLEVQYGNWTWALRSNMLTIENQLHNRIENGDLEKVDLKYLNRESIKTYKEIKTTMIAYFEDDTEKEMLAQWKGKFEKKIEDFHYEQMKRVKQKLDDVIQQKAARKNLDEKKTDFENKLLKKSKALAQQLKDKIKDEHELEKEFSCVWSGWVAKLTANTTPVEDINLEGDQFSILQDLGFELALIDECKKSDRYKFLSCFGDYLDYVKTEFLAFLRSQRGFSHEEQNQIRLLIDEALKESLESIERKPVATRGYTSTYLHEVAKHVKEKVKNFLSERKFALKKEFTVDLLLYVFYKAEDWLLKSQMKFKRNNDPLTYLESKKTEYYKVFRSFCKGNSSVVVLGELICEKLKVTIVEVVCNKTAINLAGEMRCNFPAFSGNRLNLEKHVLKSLALKNDFNDFMNYITYPRSQVEAFIKAEVENYIFTDHQVDAINMLQDNVAVISTLVSNALSTATQKVTAKTGNTDMWLKEFSRLLKGELTLDTICSQNFSDINDFEFLKEEIKKRLSSIIEEMSSLSLDKLKEARLKPDEILIDQLCKCCWVKCPFCSAVCTNTIEDHSPEDHSVPFHRPSGINGWHYRGTVEMSKNFCTTNVASDGSFGPHYDSEETIPFKMYRKAGPDYANWSITPDESKLAYWKWFVCKFQMKLEEHYNLKFNGLGEIPPEWRSIECHEAIESLDEMC